MRSIPLLLSFSIFTLFAFKADAQYIYTFAGTGYGFGTGTGDYTGDGGLAVSARLNSCTGVTFDGAGNIYIADKSNNVVRKVNVSGVITTFAGTGTAGYSGDFGPASTAKLDRPYNVASDASGNVYIADYGNNVIRKVSPSGIITTFAGSGVAGFSGDSGPASAAKLRTPTGIALDTLGNLYIADAGNNAVRKVSSGVIMTLAGNGIGGYSGDGGDATDATLHYPVSVAVDPFQQVYIADYFNNVVRKIDTDGKISTFAGNGTMGSAGDGLAATSAQLHYPAGVAVFSFGNVYISDQGNNRIRFVNSAGNISTFAGKDANGYVGDGGLAVNAELGSPKGIAVDAQNRLYIADYDNNVVRIVKSYNAVPKVADGSVVIFPNPSTGTFTVQLPQAVGNSAITVTDLLGRTVYSTTSTQTTFSITGLNSGTYFVKVSHGEYLYIEKIIVR